MESRLTKESGPFWKSKSSRRSAPGTAVVRSAAPGHSAAFECAQEADDPLCRTQWDALEAFREAGRFQRRLEIWDFQIWKPRRP